MKKVSFLLWLWCLGIIMVSCNKDDPKGGTFEKYGMSMTFPSDWTVSDGTEYQRANTIIGYSPLKNSSDVFRENANVTKYQAKDVTLDKLLEDLMNELISADITPTISPAVVNSYEAVRIGYDAYVSGYEFSFTQYLILEGEYAYIIICTALPSTYGEYAEIFDQIVQSFTIIQ